MSEKGTEPRAPFELRSLDRDNLTVVYGVASQRLSPWPLLNAPFDGAWCVLSPGGVSAAHSHHEYELFIALAGQAVIEVDGVERPFTAGDLVHLRPGSTHHVRNAADGDFQWYALWWDTDAAARFHTRHEQEQQR